VRLRRSDAVHGRCSKCAVHVGHCSAAAACCVDRGWPGIGHHRAVLHRPVWNDLISREEFAALDPGHGDQLDRRPDVLVIGGGVVGLATAFACQQAGLGRVSVVERLTVAAGASGSAAGLLIPDAHQGSDPPALVALGRASLRWWWELHDMLAGGLGIERIDWVGLDPQPLGFAADLPPGAQHLDPDDVHALVPGLAVKRGGVLLEDQARCNPLRVLARLAQAVASVTTGVEVTGVVVRGGRIVKVVTSTGTMTPGAVVFATGGPPALRDLPRFDGTWIKGHLLVTEPVAMLLPGVVTNVATQIDDGRLLVGGTLDVDDSSPDPQEAVLSAIRADLDAILPTVRTVATSHGWCCFRPATADGMPVIDRVPGIINAWMTYGHYRTGILMAPGTGRLLAQWISAGTDPADTKAFRLGYRQ
jgi:glycine/D-amino acid oxidase-like deaminating enzyme